MAKKKKKKRTRKVSKVGKISVSRLNIKRFTLKELKLARKYGFKTKKPKKPRAHTITAWENYLKRFDQWVDNVKSAAKNQQYFLQLRGIGRRT